MTLKDITQQITNQELTPLDLVEKAIQNIEKKNGELNAVVHTRYEKARHEAMNKDFSNTKYKGIPILIKSLGQDIKGEPNTNGSTLFKDSIAQLTDNFVQRIEDLGFIILGQTNVPEFGFKNITDSPLYGDAKLPHNPKHTPGGSSGGSAAALASNMVDIVSASDGGGSVRIPASYNGLVGLKPTRGSMPVGPLNYRSWQGASINFFLTKTLEDTVELFNDMLVYEPSSPFTYKKVSQLKKKYKIAYSTESPVNLPVSNDAIQAIEQTVRHLKALGHDVVEAKPDIDGMKVMESYYLVNGVETASMFKNIEKFIQRDVTIDDVQLTTWTMYQYGLSIPGYEMVDALNYWDQASSTMNQFHETYDLYLTPTTAHTAPLYDEVYQSKELQEKMRDIVNRKDRYQLLWDMFEDSLAKSPYTMLANVTGQPAISLPLYKNSDGLHLGIQFMGVKGSEELLFDISEQLKPHFIK